MLNYQRVYECSAGDHQLVLPGFPWCRRAMSQAEQGSVGITMLDKWILCHIHKQYPLVNEHSYWKWPFIVDLPITNLPDGTFEFLSSIPPGSSKELQCSNRINHHKKGDHVVNLTITIPATSGGSFLVLSTEYPATPWPSQAPCRLL